MTEKEALLRFFELTGSDTDSLIYLKKYQSLAGQKFAVIYISPEILTEYAEAIFYDLKLLSHLDLYPVLILKQESLEYLELFYQVLYHKIRLQQEDDFRLEFIFHRPDESYICQLVAEKKVPVWILPKQQNILFVEFHYILQALAANKFIFLTRNGGLVDKEQGQPISIIHLKKDFEYWQNSLFLAQDDKVLLLQMKDLLDNLANRSLTISITSPLSLLKELFTVKGKGSLIKRGSEIHLIREHGCWDMARLASLIESAFKRNVKEQFLQSHFSSLVLEVNYRGAAILKEFNSVYYLTKFAVDEIARGEGIGREIWDKMLTTHPRLFWRAQPQNMINKWYARECSGMQKFPQWNVYWIGIEPEKIPEICEIACNMPVDFESS